MKEYTFDAQMRICVRVQAESEYAARELLESHLVAADCNGGAWPNGDPILFEASLTYETPELVEVDGEAV